MNIPEIMTQWLRGLTSRKWVNWRRNFTLCQMAAMRWLGIWSRRVCGLISSWDSSTRLNQAPWGCRYRDEGAKQTSLRPFPQNLGLQAYFIPDCCVDIWCSSALQDAHTPNIPQFSSPTGGNRVQDPWTNAIIDIWHAEFFFRVRTLPQCVRLALPQANFAIYV